MVCNEDKDKYLIMVELENEKIGVQKGLIQEMIGQKIFGVKLMFFDKILDIVF